MTSLHVVHVIATMQVGGAERFCVDLAGALRASGFRTSICAMYDGGPLERTARDLGVDVHVIRRRIKHDPVAFLKLVRHLRALRPDLVHVHDTAGLLRGAPAAWLAGRSAIVGTSHDVLSLGWWRSGLLCAARTRVTALIASSPAVSRFLSTQGISTDHPLIPCGIDVRRFAYRDPRPTASPHLVTVGRLAPQKGHTYLLSAFRPVLDSHPTARLSIAGEGPLLGALRRQAVELGIQRATRFLGVCLETPTLLDTADVFCFPSLWEAQGLAVLEAQATGVPVVASAVGGVPQAVQDGVTGRLVPPADAAALAEVILALLADDPQRLALARAARARVTTWDVHAIAGQYVAVYRGSLGRRRRRQGAAA